MSDAGLKLPTAPRPGENGIRDWIFKAATIWNARIDSVSGLASDAGTAAGTAQSTADAAQTAAEAAAALGVEALEQTPATGDFRMVAGSEYGDEWLLCDGSAVSRITYSALFDKIGVSYGSGDGATTFNVPTIKAFVLDNSSGFSLDTMEKGTWNIVIRA